MKARGCLLGLIICISGWVGGTPESRADTYVRDDIIVNPMPKRFSVCHGRSCKLVTDVGLKDEQWQQIASIFSAPVSDPSEERERIASAVAAFEKVVGELAGTSDDRPENENGSDWTAQMDCIDESTNTSSYLKMLVGAGLLQWHRVEDRSTRGWFIFGWPHTTAVVRDTQSGKRWAVDSWFFANGVPPVIIPLEVWRAGWRPPNR